MFSKRLFMPISRSRGEVDQRTGPFQVVMDTWYDPRIRKMTRIYVGGATPEDLEEAKAIRETVEVIWEEGK